MAAMIEVRPINKLKAVLLDPFGAIAAEGEIFVPHVPGIDYGTPSLVDEVRTRLVGKRCALAVPGYAGPAYSVQILEA